MRNARPVGTTTRELEYDMMLTKVHGVSYMHRTPFYGPVPSITSPVGPAVGCVMPLKFAGTPDDIVLLICTASLQR